MPKKVRMSKSRNTKRRKTKTEYQERLGGSCQICGYMRCQNALHFHHIDASRKKFTISDAVRKKFTQEEINEEIQKCILVCANCHAEIHAGLVKADQKASLS